MACFNQLSSLYAQWSGFVMVASNEAGWIISLKESLFKGVFPCLVVRNVPVKVPFSLVN